MAESNPREGANSDKVDTLSIVEAGFRWSMFFSLGAMVVAFFFLKPGSDSNHFRIALPAGFLVFTAVGLSTCWLIRSLIESDRLDRDSPTASSPSQSEPHSGVAIYVVLLVIGILSFGTGYAAALIQNYFAPVGLFPIFIGAITGFSTGCIWNGHPEKTKRKVVLSALAGACVCLAVIHYGSYMLVSYANSKHTEVPLEVAFVDPETAKRHSTPPNFSEYMAKEWRRGRQLGALRVEGAWLGVWWGLDALAIIVTAVFAARLSAGVNRSPGTESAAIGNRENASGAKA